MNPRQTTLMILVAVLLSSVATRRAQAVLPPPDGGYPGGNTAEGHSALLSLTTGGFNTAVGFFALKNDILGQLNTAIGAGALFANTADRGTAIGGGALFSNTSGLQNTADGALAMFSNTTGNANTATGDSALFSNTTGFQNTADGDGALGNSTTGRFNTADGAAALANNTTGNGNTGIGDAALSQNTIGGNNIALGIVAGQNLTTGDWNIDIGNAGVANESNTIRIGDSNHHGDVYVAGIYGVSVSGLTVVMDSSDHLGTLASSRRFKEEIKPMGQASEAIFSLEPISFRYKKQIDPAGVSQFGLVAEDVEKVNPDLVVRDKEGKPYSVRYDQVNAMLLNEFLKEHCKVQELEANAARQQKRIDALTAGLQKMSAQLATASSSGGELETSKVATGGIRGGGPAPQVVKNP